MSANYLSENINNILSIARLAPSVHNTQPWKVRVESSDLRIQLDRQRILSHGDPTGRESFISLGIFSEACVIALKNCGINPLETKLKDDEVFITTELKTTDDETENVSALQKRFTDRTVYKKQMVTDSQLKLIASCWHGARVEVVALSTSEVIEATAKLTRQALLLAFSNPAFRRELTDHFVSDKKVPYGIPLSTLGTNPLKARLVKKLIASGVNRNQEADMEYRRWRSASALIFILADGDSKSYWLESGRAYLRASLEVEKMGYSQATSAAIVEAADFHEDIEKLLGTNKRIQCVLRIGKGSKRKKFSGRLTPEQILTT